MSEHLVTVRGYSGEGWKYGWTAECSCGWTADRLYTTTTLARIAADKHVPSGERTIGERGEAA